MSKLLAVLLASLLLLAACGDSDDSTSGSGGAGSTDGPAAGGDGGSDAEDGTPTEGGVLRVASANGVHTIVLVVSREPAGQRDPSMPEVREAITNTLRNRRQQLLQQAYVSSLRNDHVVVNHLAKRLVESQGKMPALAPAAPGQP